MIIDIELTRSFFMWCTIINVGLFAITFLAIALARDWVYRIQSLWFPLPRDRFTTIIYSFLGLFKILIIVFNLVPYITLLILG